MSAKSNYPWENWFSRKRPFIIKPDQYSASQNSMCVMIRQSARLHGVKVGVFKQQDGGIKIEPRGPRQ